MHLTAGLSINAVQHSHILEKTHADKYQHNRFDMKWALYTQEQVGINIYTDICINTCHTLNGT